MSHLTPRGDMRSAGSSSNVDYARSRSDHRLDWSLIRRPRSFAIRGIARSSNTHRTAAIIRNHGDARGAILIGGSSSDRCDLVRWEHRVDRDLIFIRRLRWRTVFLSLHGNLERRIPIRRRRRCVEEHHNRGPIEPRSRRDRAAIVDPSAWNLFHDPRSSFPQHLEHDRRSIVVYRGRFWSSIWSEIQANSARIWSHNAAQRKPLPRRLDCAPTTASIGLKVGPNSPFKKSHVLSSFFLTFDRFMKELSEFRGRSLVHRDPPAFRLNSEGIGAGLITNSSLISSNFPLEFRKSVRNDPSKFTPIRANWSLILMAIRLVVRFNRLSRGNLSFY